MLRKLRELVASQRMSQCKKVDGIEEGKKVIGWSTKEMKDKLSTTLVKDTEDMISWRALSQLDVNECWMKIVRKIEDEVLDKYKLENTNKEAYRGRGEPSEWRIVRRVKKYQPRKWVKVIGQKFSLGSQSAICSDSKACRKARRRRKRYEAAAKNESYEGHGKENQREKENGCEQQLVEQ